MTLIASNRVEQSGHFEQFAALTADGTILPGMLVELISAGTIQKHSQAGGHCERAFALENADVGVTAGMSGAGIDTAYGSGDRAKYVIAGRGAVVNARLASGQNVAKGQRLMSNGAGCVTAETSGDSSKVTTDIVCIAFEAINNSGGSTPHITVRVL